MESIEKQCVQNVLNRFLNRNVYLHLETSTGSYASLEDPGKTAVCAYIRNGIMQFHEGSVVGEGPYRVGLKLKDGWIYAEGLTDWEVTPHDQLLLGGYDREGHLNIALELSFKPFECGV